MKVICALLSLFILAVGATRYAEEDNMYMPTEPSRDILQQETEPTIQDTTTSNTGEVKVQEGRCACKKRVKVALLESLQSCINVLRAIESCNNYSKNAFYENVKLMSSCSCYDKVNSGLIRSLKSCISAIMTASNCTSSPASSCAEIRNGNPGSTSGNYQLQINNTRVTVYCFMEELCGLDGGWTRLAKFDINETVSSCPSPLVNVTQGTTRICTKEQTGCESIPFTSYGISYSQVCGRVRGYHRNSLDGFHNRGIDEAYVDGVSITRGSPRQHIWSLGGSTPGDNGCPCNGGTRQLPSFVSNDHYCESGFPDNNREDVFAVADPLWDGKNCTNNEGRCCSPPLLPFFLKRIGSTTTDDIEMRLCTDESPSNENIGINQYEIYVI